MRTVRTLRSWTVVPPPRVVGGNHVELLEGGDMLFPRMVQAIDAATAEVWLATYIFHHDEAALGIAAALKRAAARGVAVHVVVDGFGSMASMGAVQEQFAGTDVKLEVFRPLDRWYAWLQPGQLRRLHQKLCVCDAQVAFVGGINIIADRLDINHGWTEQPRLDFAVQISGALAEPVAVTARAMWTRSHLSRGWRDEARHIARSARPINEAWALLQQLRGLPGPAAASPSTTPLAMRAAFVVRDNVRQRRAIEQSYVQAINRARTRVDIAVPYFYPGQRFRAALRNAARRGVQVRLLMQGKVDYRVAAMAARALYDELRAAGVRVFEYTPAFLHAKVAVVDDAWATVGSSNIDPLSLLLNLEANVVVYDADFAAVLAQRFDAAFAISAEVQGPPVRSGFRGWLHRSLVAWGAYLYMRVAGITGRY
jgi:cardiolipin synthase A/B